MKNQEDFWEKFYSINHSFLGRYTVSIIFAMASLGLIKLLFLDFGGPPLTSIALLAVILSCIYGGKGPALISTLITSIGIEFLFNSTYNISFNWKQSLARIVIYGATCILVESLVDSLKKSLLLCSSQKRLVQQEKQEKEEILSVVSHDLKSPLSSIILSISVLKRKVLENGIPEEMAKLVSTISNAAKRMSRLIEDLLDAVKLESHQLSLIIEKHSLIEVIEAAIEESKYSALSKKIQIKFLKSEHYLEVNCDRERLIQVMSNLLGNAIKFSPEESVITVSIASSLAEAVVCVKDEGRGIAPENIPKLFNKYWQEETTSHMGIGLGLFIAQKILDMHHGKIQVESELGKGSLFKIYLPRV